MQKKVRLGDIATLITKGTTPTSIGYSFVDSGINFIKIESLNDQGGFIPEKFAFINEECNAKMQRSQLRENDILFSIAGAIGKKAVVSNNILPANTNQALAIIRIPKGKINHQYLFYALESDEIKKQFEKQKQGVAQLNLSLKDISELEINLVSKEEQDKTVAVIGTVDNLIVKRKKQLQNLDELVKSRFVDMFGTINDNRFGYEIKQLQEVCKPIKDGTHQTPVYTEDSINGYKFLSSKDVTSGTIDWNHVKYIPEVLHNELYARITPEKGDILLAKNGTTGVAAIVDRDEIFDIYVSLALLKPINIDTVYLWAAINSIETKKQFDASLKGIGVPNLHLTEIRKTKIVVPPVELQEQFAIFVAQIDKSKLYVQKNLERLEMLRKSLMQKYFG